MDQEKTGSLIRLLRLRQNMTQAQLAEKIAVSDKAVSKWERGCGAPDLSVLPALAGALQTDVQTLLSGSLRERERQNGNLKKLKFHVCPVCHNLLFATGEAEISCCGQKVFPLQAAKAGPEHSLHAERNDEGWYITSGHAMQREHYISFVALLSDECLLVKKLYPEWGLETRLPRIPNGVLLWYCTQHGLFYQTI